MGRDKFYRVTRQIGLKMMQNIQRKLLLQYTQEKITLWDKRHDAWIAKLEQDRLNKEAGLRGIAAIMKKWDQQKAAALLTAWNKNENEHERKVHGLMMIRKIIDGWEASIKKAMIMNMRAKLKVHM